MLSRKENTYFITGTAYAGKSTMVKMLAEKHNGILCEENYHDKLLMEEPDPEKAMENYRQGLMLINSKERYERSLNAGFPVILRDENRSVEQTLEMVEKVFGLTK